MAESGIKSYFPSQTVSDAEKLSYEYGLKVGKAIEQEWFNNDRGGSRYNSMFLYFLVANAKSPYLCPSKFRSVSPDRLIVVCTLQYDQSTIMDSRLTVLQLCN